MTISMPEEIEKKAQTLISGGARFEVEELRTGEVYMECLAKDDQILANQLCINGPPVVKAVEELVLSASAKFDDKN